MLASRLVSIVWLCCGLRCQAQVKESNEINLLWWFQLRDQSKLFALKVGSSKTLQLEVPHKWTAYIVPLILFKWCFADFTPASHVWTTKHWEFKINICPCLPINRFSLVQKKVFYASFALRRWIAQSAQIAQSTNVQILREVGPVMSSWKDVLSRSINFQLNFISILFLHL